MKGVLNDDNVTYKNTYWEARKVARDKLKKKVATYKMGLVDKLKEAVMLQALEALFRMATYGCLSVQEKHMHMVLTMNILRSQMHDWSFQIDNYHGSGMVPLADLSKILRNSFWFMGLAEPEVSTYNPFKLSNTS
ncbi:Protein SIEL [Zea mays]|uniref:Protein SIEL n=1 Tax=Zea mays TaxID=4577 RepID=A0A1D6GCN6_MAIZE|nr:Protein SIEL [Zea mays]